MEEAYSELYQQFLRLRSLCLRQAALLHQLTTALQKQQGASVPNGEFSDMMSIPVQCSQEIPEYLHKKPEPLTATAAPSDLLAEDMSKLCVDGPRQRKENQEPLKSLDFLRWQGASSKNLLQADHPSGDRTMPTVRMPGTEAPSVVSDFRGPSDELLMSDVALQSHVCEFCQAVFPGDTTTRGEFLRHLYTHVT